MWAASVAGAVALAAFPLDVRAQAPRQAHTPAPARTAVGVPALPPPLAPASTVAPLPPSPRIQPPLTAPPRPRATPPVDGGEAQALPLGPSAEAARTQLARERHAMGLRHFKAKDYPRALSGFQDAYALDPRNAEIVNDLAYVYQLLGNVVEAERYYRETLLLSPERGIARINLADLLHQKGATPQRLEDAATQLARARELLGNRPGLLLRQARLAVSRGLVDEAVRFYGEAVAARAPTDALMLEIGDVFRDFGREEEALAWYRRVPDRSAVARDAAQRIWLIGVEREARRYGWTKPPSEIPAAARTLATKARQLHTQGRHAEAERLARRALRTSPQFAAARLVLGDVLRDTGRRDEAEVTYLRALAFDQGNPELYARLGRLYLVTPKSTRAGEAALFLQRALELRPDWNELHLQLARAYRRTGDLVRAMLNVERFLAQPASPEEHREARALLTALAPLVRARSKDPASPPSLPSLEPQSAAAASTMNRARVLLARGQPDAAMAELKRLDPSARTADVLNLEGAILFASGRLEEAANALKASLGKVDAQGATHAQLGVVLTRLGRIDEARRHFERGNVLGDFDAAFQLAKLDAGAERGFEAVWRDLFAPRALAGLRRRLSALLEGATSSVYLDEARALRDALEQRWWWLVGAWCALALSLVLGGLVWRWRRLGGVDLRTLLLRHPEAGPEVQRILSAIRHEVLKHNTLVLTGLADALERGEPAAEMAAHCQRSLFGVPGGASGAASRLATYADELTQAGRAHGVRLNLQRRDPALSALLRGFRAVSRVSTALARVDALSPRARGRVARQLKLAAHLLNSEGYEAVRALLEGLRVLVVDEALLRGLFERTLREPGLAVDAARVAPLVFEGDALPLAIVIPRRAFEDVLQNLLRNALQSSLRHLGGAVHIGLSARAESDPITGIERALFFIHDESPAQLTAEMLRGRYIEEGLGITADIVSRYDGTLDVFPGEGRWAKSVVVKLPRAEADDGEEGERR